MHGRPSPGVFPELSGQDDVWPYGFQSVPEICKGEAMSSCLNQ